MDKLVAMRSLVAVVDSGGFSAAARVLGQHKATLSQHVGQLERDLGVRLLARTTRSLALTAEGQRYLALAREVVQRVDEAEGALRQARSGPAGPLRVEVPTVVGRSLLMQEIGDFVRRYPGIAVEVNCTDRRADLVSEGLDVALRAGALPDSTLTVRPVGSIRFALYASPRYLGRAGVPESPSELATHRWVVYRPAGRGVPMPVSLNSGDRRETLDPKPALVVDDAGAALEAARAGVGVAQLSCFAASRHERDGDLVRVLPGWQGPALPVQIVTPSRRQRALRVQVFCDWLVPVLQRRLGDEAAA